MSLDNITLNTDVFVPINIGNTKVVRKVIAGTVNNVSDPVLMEVSHLQGSANKPTRTMVKFSGQVDLGSTYGGFKPVSCHIVFTYPLDMSATMVENTFASAGSLLDNLSDYLTANTWAKTKELVAGSLG